MHRNCSIVVTFDRLGAGYLGPYGNTWIETPHFNRLASTASLFEFASAQSPLLEESCRSWWSGRHVLDRCEVNLPQTLPAVLAERGIAATLVTDDASLLEHPLTAAFAETVPVLHDAAARPADDEGQTEMAQLFAAALAALASSDAPQLLWIHCRGMQGAWDAPYPLRRQFADEEDPEPPTFVVPPSEVLPPDFDPDVLLGYTQAYAAQVVLADMCLGALLDAIEESDQREATLLVVAAARGFPLGEHRAVGACGDALRGEVLHTPLIVRAPGDMGVTLRTTAFVQPPDLFTTLVDWHGGGPVDDQATLFGEGLLPLIRGEGGLARSVACSAFGEQRAIRTPAWFYRRDATGAELYAKPDDRWEVNEVSDRCADVARQLAELLARCEQEIAATGRLAPRGLEDVLAYGYD